MLRNVTRLALRTVGRVYPFHRTGRVVHNALTRWATSPLKDALPIRCRNGLTLYVVPSELIGRQIYLTRTWDPHLLVVLEALAQGSSVVLDVGANVGFFALSMAAAAPGATIHAVEPQPRLAELIERSALASAIPRVRVHRVGLSSSFGEATLVINPANLGSSRIEADPVKSAGGIRIPLIGGREFLDALGVPEVDLMKLDVEGHEAQVLRGVEPWLAAQRIRRLVFETRGHGDDRGAIATLVRHGYRLFGIDKRLTSPRICQCPTALHAKHEDLIAVSGGALAATTDVLRPWLVPHVPSP